MNGEIWQFMGRIMETHDAVVVITMVTAYVAEKNKCLLMDAWKH